VQNGGYCILSVLLSLGVATLLPFFILFFIFNKNKNTSARQKHARSRHFAPFSGLLLNSRLKNHSPPLPISFYMTHVLFRVLLVLRRKTLETLGEIALLSALCMFCQSLWGRPARRSHIGSHSTDVSLYCLSFFTSSLLPCVC